MTRNCIKITKYSMSYYTFESLGSWRSKVILKQKVARKALFPVFCNVPKIIFFLSNNSWVIFLSNNSWIVSVSLNKVA